MAALLSVLVLLFFAIRMFIWPTFFAGDQEKMAGGIPEATATSASAGDPTASQPSPVATVATSQPTAGTTPPPATVQPTTVPIAAQTSVP
ncbi:MAG: hypothetical protein ACOX87_05025, partial [Chloroflexota bacterium]